MIARGAPFARALAMLSLASAMTVARPAAACGPTPPAFWTFLRTHPADGAREIPGDVVVVFQGRAHTTIYPDDRHGSELQQVLRVRVVEHDTRREIPGQLGYWAGPPAAASWRPLARLEPETTYELDAVIANVAPPVPEALSGSQALKVTFTTSAATFAPVTTTGALAAKGEIVREPVYPCSAFCGGPPPCKPSGTRPVPHARLTIPPISGGWAPLGYQVWVWSVRGRPGDVEHAEDLEQFQSSGTHQGFAVVDGAAPATLMVPLPDSADRICFHVRLFDTGNRSTTLEPACIEGGTIAESSGGCSVGRGSVSAATSLSLILLLWLAVRGRGPRTVPGRCRGARLR